MRGHAMERQHARLHRSLAVLAPPRRFQLLTLVLEGVDRSVSQLARAVRLSQSCTTRHLQALERAGLVRRWRDGKRVVFRPAPRDAEAGAVIASLAGSGAAVGTEAPPARGPAAARRGRRRAPGSRAIPVASTAELEPVALEDGPGPGAGWDGRARSALERGTARGARPATAAAREVVASAPRGEERERAPAPEEPESGISTPAAPRPRYWSEIEDFLL